MAKYLPYIPIDQQEYLVNYYLRHSVLNNPDSSGLYTSDSEDNFKLALYPSKEESHYPEKILQIK